MLGLALVFLIVALFAGVLGAGRVEFISAEIAWVLFVAFILLSVISFLLRGRRSAPPL